MALAMSSASVSAMPAITTPKPAPVLCCSIRPPSPASRSSDRRQARAKPNFSIQAARSTQSTRSCCPVARPSAWPLPNRLCKNWPRPGAAFKAGPARVPIVPAAILFDLANGGKKPDDLQALYRTLGQTAFHNADQSPRLGDVGAGTGATIGTGGSGALGTASCVFNEHAPEPLQDKTVAALVAVNAVGSPFLGQGPHLRAWPFELDEEFGGLGAGPVDPTQLFMKTLAEPGQNTTIGCIITDIALDKRGCHGLAIAGQDGISAAIYPAHTALDGDLVFGASVGTNDPIAQSRFTSARAGRSDRNDGTGHCARNLPGFAECPFHAVSQRSKAQACRAPCTSFSLPSPFWAAMAHSPSRSAFWSVQRCRSCRRRCDRFSMKRS
jgi:hypothetical protein